MILSIEESEVLGVMGPNGAGKSTLLKLMALLEEPTSGTIYYRERQIYPEPFRSHYAGRWLLFFNMPFFWIRRYINNIAVGLKIRKIAKEEQRRRV